MVSCLAFPKCTSIGPSVSMDTVLVKECSAVLSLRVGWVGSQLHPAVKQTGLKSPVGLLPWQIGVGRIVSIKNWWFSGSMLIYQRVIYNILFYNVLYTIATQSPVDFPSRSHLSQETHKGEPSQSPCTEEGPICSSSDLGRSPRLRSTWLQRPCPDSPASPIPLPRWVFLTQDIPSKSSCR